MNIKPALKLLKTEANMERKQNKKEKGGAKKVRDKKRKSLEADAGKMFQRGAMLSPRRARRRRRYPLVVLLSAGVVSPVAAAPDTAASSDVLPTTKSPIFGDVVTVDVVESEPRGTSGQSHIETGGGPCIGTVHWTSSNQTQRILIYHPFQATTNKTVNIMETLDYIASFDLVAGRSALM